MTGEGQPPFVWPTEPASTVLVADVSNAVERQLLDDWIASSGSRAGAQIVVNTERFEEADADAIEGHLGEDSATVVPARVVWLPEGGLQRSRPRLRDLLLGDPRHPSEPMARLFLRRHPERARCIVGEPATVADLHQRHQAHDAISESLGTFALRSAGVTLDLAERQLQGRRYKVPRFVTQGVLGSPEFNRAIDALAASTGDDRAGMIGEARGYLAEMVAQPSSFFIDWAGMATRWITALGYREIVVDPEAVDRARSAVRDHPSALLFTHKTHMDGIALMSVLYEHDFPAPHIMAGINMSFAGVGTAARRSGGIFIRRTFQDNPIYKVTLQQYLGFLMGKRFPFMWAFEGTRSRSGKLLPPRYGMLKYVVDAAHATDASDLHLIPVSISYDLLGEVSDYAGQELGRAKEAENLSWFVEYLRRLRSPMGRIYLDFAEPVVIDGEVPPAVDADLPEIAFEVARRANACVPVTLPALLCTVLLGAQPVALTRAELEEQMQGLFEWLRSRHVRLAGGFIGDHASLEELADVVFERGLVHRYDEGTETVFTITEDQHAAAGFYRNTIVHYFLDKAMAEVALVGVIDVEPQRRLDQFWVDLHWLRDAFKFEFYLTPSEQFGPLVDAELSRSDPNWDETLAGDATAVEQLVRSCRPLVGHTVLQPYVESYGVVAEVFAHLGQNETLERKEATGRALALAEQMYLQRRISSRASIGKLMFDGAHKLLEAKSLLEPREQVSEDRKGLSGRFTELALQLERLRQLGSREGTTVGG